jgi:myo-inositol-1(or 4)-monophosphatase
LSDDLASILRVAESAADSGAHVLRRYWHDGVELRDKSELGGKTYDLVSDADLESQSVIAGLLGEEFPSHELMGEEDLVGNTDAEHLWIIDPLDGTNNFAHRIPHFAVSIAYYRNSVPTVGVIVNPITEDRFTAVRGRGAFHNGHRMECSSVSEFSKAMVGCGFYYDRGDMMRRTLAAIDDFFGHHIHGVRRFGTAALDLCFVANGQFGAFFEYKLSPWDFAAGQLMVTEAGGRVTDARGNPLRFEASSVLASNGRLHEAALEITARHHPEA